MKTFSIDDVKRFEQFLNSPFFNQSKKLIKLYNVLIRFYPAFNSKFLSEQNLNKRVSPDLDFNRFTMNRLFFDLYRCEEKFLLIKSLEADPIKSQDLLRREFFERKLFKLIDKNIRFVTKNLDSNTNINAEYYLNKINLNTDMCNLTTITLSKSNKFHIKTKFEGLSDRAKYITYFFVTEMIREFENFSTHDKTYNIERNFNFIKNIFTVVDFPGLLRMLISNSGNPAYSNNLNVYLALLLTFSNMENEEYYFGYKKKLYSNLSDLSVDEKRFHFGRLIRYCMMKREVQDQYNKFNYELFNVYVFVLNNENFKSSVMKYIPVELYRSILLHSLRLKKYKWSIEFIKKYSKLINPEKRKNIYYYSIAEYYFHRKMFKDARHNLHKITFDEFIYKIDYKNLMLIANYELKEYESALSLIDSYKRFLGNDNTLSRDSRQKHKSFINIVKNLIQYITSANKVSTYHFEKAFDYDLPFSSWVKEKIEELNIKSRQAI